MALTLTQNLSLTFASSEDVRLDFMFQVIEGSSLERTTDLLSKSWNKSPLDTLKLLFYTRDIRRGKGNRAQFLLCSRWLYEHQFETLIKTLPFFAEFGCFKDYFNLLLIALFDELPYDCFESEDVKKKPADIVSKFDRIILKRLDKETKQAFNQTRSTLYSVIRKQNLQVTDKIPDSTESMSTDVDPNFSADAKATTRKITKRTKIDQKQLELEAAKRKKNDKKLTYSEIREIALEREDESSKKKHERKMQRANGQPNKEGFLKFKTDKKKLKLLNQYRKDFIKEKLSNDKKFTRLYETIVELFVTQLVKDYESFKTDESVSLLSKWIPNRGRQFDKHLQIQLPIAKQVLERIPEFKNAQNPPRDDKQTVFEFEKLIAKLRRKIHVPEIEMSGGLWNEIVYGKVTSKAMLRYKSSFVRNDNERFEKFVTESKTIKGSALTPAEIIREYCRNFTYGEEAHGEGSYTIFCLPDPETYVVKNPVELMTLDKQWLSLVEDLKKKNPLLLENALAVCDVSGSMGWTQQNIQPIFAAVGLSLILMNFTTGIWAKKCIAFSEEPKIFNIDIEKDLYHQIRQIMNIDAGMSTNLNAVFDLILGTAKEARLPQERMPKILFIFSDMEFNVACPEMTNFEVAQQQYRTAGYEMPVIVFWNLNGDKKERSTPVKCTEQGVVLLSGYSAQTLGFFTCEDLESISPMSMLNKILTHERYGCFVDSFVPKTRVD